ncbi:MAG: acetyltransferase [Allosphingosinicella sp.]
MRLVIFGPGGFGREILEIARLSANRDAEPGPIPEVVFAADVAGEDVLGVRVIGLDELEAEDRLVIALGSSAARRDVAERLRHFPAGRVIAPSALIGPEVTMGEGAVVCDHCTFTASATIGRHFQCNIYSYVAHDCRIGDFVTFAPRVSCNGNVHVHDGAYIGTGAVIKQGNPGRPTVIGAGAVVGMGAVVTKDVPPGATVVGNPAGPFERRSRSA